jgi:hypothetical protein
MTKKITKNFAVHNARQFVESIDEQSNSIYYVFGGRHITWPDEANPPEITDSLEDTYYQLYRDMMFGKKVSPSDMKHMVVNNAWDTTGNTVYSKFDNRAPSLDNFFVVAQNGAKYDVFKCLDNNKGAKSTVKPTFVSGMEDDEVYITTADGYQWKFMYQISSAEYNKFATTTRVPVIPSANVSGNATPGAIDVMTVNTGGSRYFSVANGVVKVANVAGNTLIHELESLVSANIVPTSVTNGSFTVERLDLFGKHANGDINTSNNVANGVILQADSTLLRITDIAGNFFGQTSNVIMKGQTSGAVSAISTLTPTTTSLSANTDFYKGSVLYISSGAGAGQQRTISEYIVTGSARRVLTATEFDTAIDSTSRFEISPRVVVDGDGSGVQARAIVNTTSFAVDTIDIINRGSGYSHASVKVFGNTGIVESGESAAAQANNANVSVIIGPPGGHGSDVISELDAKTVGISIDFANTENGNISINNDYRQFGILKDPLFANVQLSISDTTLNGGGTGSETSFAVGSIIVLDGPDVLTSSANSSIHREEAQASGKAWGVVKSRASGTIAVGEVYGTLVSSKRIFDSANTSALVGSVLTNPTRSSSTAASFDQRLVLTGFANTSSVVFQNDETIKQDSTDATGVIEVINTTSVAITRTQGNWLASDTVSGTYYNFTGQQSAGVGYFTGIRQPDLIKGSGEILYVENQQPITRAADQTERVKLLIEF